LGDQKNFSPRGSNTWKEVEGSMKALEICVRKKYWRKLVQFGAAVEGEGEKMLV
jgi:hypothetical protein